MFYVLRTGCQWEALKEIELCAKSTAHNRFREWVAADVFLQLWQAGVERVDQLQGIEWDWLCLDGAMTTVPLGGGETGPNPTDRAKGGVKRRLLTEGHGIPMGLALEGANRSDMKLVQCTLDSLVVERSEPTAEQPQGMCLDTGDDDDEGRELLAAFGFTAHIPARGEEAQALTQEAGCRARRWAVERTHSWMNRCRQILGRWDKKPEHDLAFLHVACTLIAFRTAGLFG
jgi:transposase